MTNKPARPKPRVIDLKPKPQPRAGGRIDTPADRTIFSVGMKLLHLIAAHPFITAAIVGLILVWIVWSFIL